MDFFQCLALSDHHYLLHVVTKLFKVLCNIGSNTSCNSRTCPIQVEALIMFDRSLVGYGLGPSLGMANSEKQNTIDMKLTIRFVCLVNKLTILMYDLGIFVFVKKKRKKEGKGESDTGTGL